MLPASSSSRGSPASMRFRCSSIWTASASLAFRETGGWSFDLASSFFLLPPMDAFPRQCVLYCQQIHSRNRAAMPDHETKIKLIEDRDATGEVAQVYDEWRAKSGRQQVPGILKCFSHRPDFLREVMKFSDTVHFSEGHLNRRTKEAIASWVSWLNRCPY